MVHEAAVTGMRVCVMPGGELVFHFDVAVGDEIELHEDAKGKLVSRKVMK